MLVVPEEKNIYQKSDEMIMGNRPSNKLKKTYEC